jgi:hypothetical protein
MNIARFSQKGDTNYHLITVVIVGDNIIIFSDPTYFVLKGNITANP